MIWQKPTSINWYNPLGRKNRHLQWICCSFHRENTRDGIYAFQPPAEMEGKGKVSLLCSSTLVLSWSSEGGVEVEQGGLHHSTEVKQHNERKWDCGGRVHLICPKVKGNSDKTQKLQANHLKMRDQITVAVQSELLFDCVIF